MTSDPSSRPLVRGAIGWSVALFIVSFPFFFCGTYNLCFEGFISRTGNVPTWGWTASFYAGSLFFSVLGCIVTSARMKSTLAFPGLAVVILSLDASIALASILVLLVWLARISPLSP